MAMLYIGGIKLELFNVKSHWTPLSNIKKNKFNNLSTWYMQICSNNFHYSLLRINFEVDDTYLSYEK